MSPDTPTTYAVAHTVCGHIACIYGTRRVAESARFLIGVTTGQSVAAWRVREATDDDIAALLRGGEACDQCRTGGH